MQWGRPVPVGSVWISAQFDEAEHGFPLSGRIPSRRTWDAVNRVVQRLGAAPVDGADEGATINQLAYDAHLKGGRGDVQSAVAAVHVVLDLPEEVILAGLSGGTNCEPR